jgi:hypothetical protein
MKILEKIDKYLQEEFDWEDKMNSMGVDIKVKGNMWQVDFDNSDGTPYWFMDNDQFDEVVNIFAEPADGGIEIGVYDDTMYMYGGTFKKPIKSPQAFLNAMKAFLGLYMDDRDLSNQKWKTVLK